MNITAYDAKSVYDSAILVRPMTLTANCHEQNN